MFDRVACINYQFKMELDLKNLRSSIYLYLLTWYQIAKIRDII